MPVAAVKPNFQKPDISSIDFSQSPFIVIWEMTRACGLKCVHCRAEAITERNPDELNKTQAFALIDEIRRFGRPLVVLTGGDPIRHPDCFDIVEYGAGLGLRMALTPSGTQLMTKEIVRKMKEKGLARLAVSLDGSTREIHDAFRQVNGSYDWTMNIIRWANEAELSVQINTTVTKHNINDIDNLCALMESLKISLWSVFFLVPVGRGKIEDEVTARDYELVFNKMYQLSKTCSFDIKSTEAPHYRRVVVQRKKREQDENRPTHGSVTGSGFFTPGVSHSRVDGIGRAARGVNDGNGFVFISHTGEIWPSGFLPLSAGNVKTDSLVKVYRESALFKELRDYSQIKGKCGVCEYRDICAGSRARAYGVFGDYMQSDPFCVYVPKGYQMTLEEKKYW